MSEKAGKLASVNVFSTADALSQSVGKHIAQLSQAAIADHGRFRVAFSGGSLPKLVAAGLLTPSIRDSVEWNKWDVFFSDERCVASDNKESNFGLLLTELVQKLSARPSASTLPTTGTASTPRIHAIDFSLVDSPAKCAAAYESAIRKVFDCPVSNTASSSSTCTPTACLPIFDLVLLGMGEDGHTCSLFPGHRLVAPAAVGTQTIGGTMVTWITDSPKMPPNRVTLTLPVLLVARHTAFVTTGAGKKDILRRVFTDPQAGHQLPCAMVQGSDVQWFVDSAAMQLVPT